MAENKQPLSGLRPEGLAGLLIDEIEVVGIQRTRNGLTALVSADGKSYLIRESTQLFDGDVLRIDRDEVVFKQVLQDPAAAKPFREVVKRVRGRD